MPIDAAQPAASVSHDPAGSPSASGRIRDEHATSGERSYVLWMHLSSLLGFLVIGPFSFLIPLVMWQTRRTASPLIDDHGREIMNLWITGGLLLLAGMITGIGILVWFVWSIVQLVNVIRACIASSESEYFRYPMLLRLLS